MPARPYHSIDSSHPASISLFADVRGNTPHKTLTFKNFEKVAKAFRKNSSETKDKAKVVLYSRCEAVGGRLREHLRGPALVILDIDKSETSMHECSARLARLGVAHIGHTTWSHVPESLLGEHCYRIITDIVCDDWRTVEGLTRELKYELDIDIDDVSRHQICFFVPATKEEYDVERVEWFATPSTWQPDPESWSDVEERVEAETEGEPAEPQREPETINLDEVRDALAYIDEDERESWITVGQALQGSGLAEGREIWDDWSQQSGKFDKDDQESTWLSFKRSGLTGRGIGSLFRLAMQADPPWNAAASARRVDATTPAQDFGEEDQERDSMLKDFNDKYAFCAIGMGRVYDYSDAEFRQTRTFLDLWNNPKFPTGRFIAGQVEMEPIGKTWFHWPDRKSFHRVGFLPPGGDEVLPETTLNMWQGWEHAGDPEMSMEDAKLGCDRLLDHIHEVVCKGNEELYAWVVNWCAHYVQRPYEKPGTAIVMQGNEGTGKGIFANALVSMIGNHHGVHITKSGHLTGNFNNHLANKVMVFADEVTWGGRKSDEGALKTLITEPHLVMEPKGVDAFMVRSFCRLVIASNEDWVIPTGPTARRFLFLEVSDSRRGDLKYFKNIDRQLRSGGLAAFHRYLQGVDLSVGPNPREIIRTSGLFQQKLNSLESVGKWLADAFDGECLPYVGVPWLDETSSLLSAQVRKEDDDELPQGMSPSEMWVDGDLILDSYQRHARANGEKRPVTMMTLGKRMKKYLGKVEAFRPWEDGRRTRTFKKLPLLDEAMLNFAKVLGSPEK